MAWKLTEEDVATIKGRLGSPLVYKLKVEAPEAGDADEAAEEVEAVIAQAPLQSPSEPATRRSRGKQRRKTAAPGL